MTETTGTTEPTETLAAPASGNWQKLARTAIALACLYLATCLFRLGFTVYETGRLISLVDNPPADGFTQVQTLTHQERILGLLLVAAMAGALIAYYVFLRDARNTVRAAGLDAKVVVRHWSVALWRAALVVNLLAAIVLATSLPVDESSGAASFEDRIRHIAALDELGLGIRCLAILALIGAVIGLRARLRSTFADAQA